MSSVDEELRGMILNHDIKIDIRLEAWKYVLGLTTSEEGIKQLKTQKYGPFLVAYLTNPRAEVEALDVAHKCLISLSTSAVGSTFLLENKKDFVSLMLQDISASSSNFVEKKCCVLSNLSRHCNILAKASQSFQELWRTNLQALFCSPEKEVRERYTFLSFVFSNIATNTEGRRLFIEDESFLRSFFLGLDPEESDLRRLGMALTIRSCCQETSYLKKLLEDYNILPVLLLPLMGNEEYDSDIMSRLPPPCRNLGENKQREKLPQIRKALVQALSLLCYTEEAWEFLQDSEVYYVARELHLAENDPGVIEAIETLVGFLLVENYADSESLQQTSVLPSETDVMQDIPEVVL